jgi:hypothetical protein
MNLLDSQPLLPWVVGLAISAVLLWLASETFASARTRARPTSRHLKACAIVLGGFELRTDATIIRYPDRYSDPRGVKMWETVMGLLKELTACPTCSARATSM